MQVALTEKSQVTRNVIQRQKRMMMMATVRCLMSAVIVVVSDLVRTLFRNMLHISLRFDKSTITMCACK